MTSYPRCARCGHRDDATAVWTGRGQFHRRQVCHFCRQALEDELTVEDGGSADSGAEIGSSHLGKMSPEAIEALRRRASSDPVIRDFLYGPKPVITPPVGSKLRDKLEALAAEGSGATEGERDAARRALERISR